MTPQVMTSSDEVTLKDKSSEEDIQTTYEPNAYAISKVCFSVCVIATLLHCSLLIGSAQVRRLYGLHLTCALFMMLLYYIFTMSSCCLPKEHLTPVKASLSNGTSMVTPLHSEPVTYTTLVNAEGFARNHGVAIIGALNHFSVLSYQCWITLACYTTWILVYRGCHNRSSSRLLNCTTCIWSVLIAVIFPLLLVIATFLTRDHLSQLSLFSTKFNIAHSSFNNMDVECGIDTAPWYKYSFFLPLMLLMVIQAILLISLHVMWSKRENGREDRYLLCQNTEIRTRFWMITKLAACSLFIWPVAALATFQEIVEAWHIYTLFSALLCIFITINFIFSRPMLNILQHWKCDNDLSTTSRIGIRRDYAEKRTSSIPSFQRLPQPDSPPRSAPRQRDLLVSDENSRKSGKMGKKLPLFYNRSSVGVNRHMTS